MPTKTRRAERHKSRNEPTVNSNDPNEPSQPSLFLEEAPRSDSQNTPRSVSAPAFTEQPALGDDHFALMEAIVDPINLEIAWARTRANRGACGPDGVTLEDFSEWFIERWPEIQSRLLRGTYQPSPARRVSIPKPDGGTRDLGIPNVIDRVIQQAIVLILTPIFDPEFSDSSFGYRPYRSAQDAVKQVQQVIRSGRTWCVDMDLSKFFDRVNHDRLMNRIGRKVRDKRLLKLIGRYLRAGVLVDGQHQPSREGTIQGGPLSPLLSNIYLDDFGQRIGETRSAFRAVRRRLRDLYEI